MTRRGIVLCTASLVLLGTSLGANSTQPGSSGMPQANSTANATPYQQTLTDIQKTVGFVPDFMRNMSDAALPGFWQEMKGLEMNPSTALSAKTKELIGLAVASQVPCQYCVYFHTQAAKAHGASD